MLTTLDGRMPGVTAERVVTPRQVDVRNPIDVGVILAGASARDPGNTPIWEVRAGTILGKITASGKYAPWVAGISQAPVSNPFTVITVTAAQATEIVRRWGQSTGTLYVTGPATAGGSLVGQEKVALTVSAINTGNGQITVGSTAKAFIAGSILTYADGSHDCMGFLRGFDRGYPISVVDEDFNNRDVSTSMVVKTDWLDPRQLVDFPSDVTLVAWVKTMLKAQGYYVFVDLF